MSFRQKKESEQRLAYRPLHVVFFPLGGNPEKMEQIHANLNCCGDASVTVGSGYKIKLGKDLFAITRPNDITSLLVQAQVQYPTQIAVFIMTAFSSCAKLNLH